MPPSFKKLTQKHTHARGEIDSALAAPYDELMKSGDGRQRRTEWQGGMMTACLLPRASYDVAYTPTQTVAGFSFDIQTGEHAFGSDRVKPFTALPQSCALTPAGCDIRSRSRMGGEYLTLTVRPGAEASYIGRYDTANARQFNNAVSPDAITLARSLRTMLLTGHQDEGLMEEASVLLFDAVLAAELPDRKPATSLTPARLRKFHDLLEARFSERLSLLEMAETLGLSAAYFIRAFKAATGTTPHACLMDRRMAEARHMLATTDDTVASIAAACGFSSQAHMANVFRARLGVSPAAYRTALS